MKIIGDSLRKHPEHIFLTATSTGTLKMMMTGNHAFTFVAIYDVKFNFQNFQSKIYLLLNRWIYSIIMSSMQPTEPMGKNAN